jgi:hypothetical protein
MNLFMRALAAAALLGLATAGCGGGKSTTTTTTTSTTAAPAAAMGNSQSQTQAVPAGSVAAVPAGLNCGAVQPVWVNTHSKAWHEPGDPYYGRTKAGQYMCPSAAAAAGYHAAGSGMHTGKHHKGHNNNGNAMGAPDATPTP